MCKRRVIITFVKNISGLPNIETRNSDLAASNCMLLVPNGVKLWLHRVIIKVPWKWGQKNDSRRFDQWLFGLSPMTPPKFTNDSGVFSNFSPMTNASAQMTQWLFCNFFVNFRLDVMVYYYLFIKIFIQIADFYMMQLHLSISPTIRIQF